MDHADLVSEYPTIEKLTPAERIQLARERRALQLLKWRERDRAGTEALSRTQKVQFKAGIALLEATSRNDPAEVEKLLADGANPNSHNEDGLTPLHQCAIDNNVEILVILLDHGADVNAQDTELWTPLHAAACCAHLEVVKHLIERGANLLAVNADGNMPYDICDDDTTLDVIESEMARRGISQEDIDEERGGGERVMLADMKWLHQHGAPLDYKDRDGATPLHVAACNGYYDVAAFLLHCGVSPAVPDEDSWLPIHAAACWAQPDLIELLAEYGADVNAKTDSGETPLDLCEDDTTRHVILTLQAEALRRRRQAFPRDSRRQSKKRKSFSKFESPQTATATADSPFSARAGVTLARIEARQEAALLRSFSLEDTSAAAMASTKANGSPAQLNGTDGSEKKKKKGRTKKAKESSGEDAKSKEEWQKSVEEPSQDSSTGDAAAKTSPPDPPERAGKARRKDRRIEESPKRLIDKSGEPVTKSEAAASSGLSQLKQSRAAADEGPSNGNHGLTLADISLDGEGKKHFKAPKDMVVGDPERSGKRFACCSVS